MPYRVHNAKTRIGAAESRRRGLGMGVAVAILAGPAAAAAQAIAGREIVNVATVTYTVEGRPGSADSNAARDRVHEVLGVRAAPALEGPTPAGDGERARPIAFRLTNAGNGREAFRLTLETPAVEGSFTPHCPRLTLDSDNDGAPSPADAVYAEGQEPVLEPGASSLVFALCDIPESVSDGQSAPIHLTAEALTGSGAVGLRLAGRGDEGVDAFVGQTSARVRAESGVVIDLGRPTLLKAQSVQDPTGGARVIPGAIVTYTLTARVAGRGVARDVVVEDAVPAGVSYVAGSLSLDGAPLTDSADADVGRFTGQSIEFALGSVEQSRDRIMSFQVRVK